MKTRVKISHLVLLEIGIKGGHILRVDGILKWILVRSEAGGSRDRTSWAAHPPCSPRADCRGPYAFVCLYFISQCPYFI